MNYSERIEWMKGDSMYADGGHDYSCLREVLMDLRTEVESYVQAYELDFAYDVQELTVADMSVDTCKYALLLRELGTWLVAMDAEDGEERLNGFKERYSQWIVFEITKDISKAPFIWNVKMVDYKSKED